METITMIEPDILANDLGADIKALRRRRKMTLQQLADGLQKSVGWLSQVERGLSSPDIMDLRQLAAFFDVPLSLFFGETAADPSEKGRIVRASTRRTLGTRESGLLEELLSPDLTDDFEVVRSVFEPGSESAGPVIRQTQEVGYLVSGRLDLWIAGIPYKLNASDSFRIKGEAQQWANPYDEPAVVIWIISPPVY
jgi:transcriptional regulator with XRE-family HTH domain